MVRPVTPDLRQMRYVVEVAREQSFSRAALNLHVAQQAVSQQVKAVEGALGVQLFTRPNRGVQLTAAGETFVQEARRALHAADRVGQRAQAAARGEVGTCGSRTRSPPSTRPCRRWWMRSRPSIQRSG